MEKRKKPRRVIPRKLFKIGEVMRYTGLSRQTIHNYTMLGLLTEDERTQSGHRLYGEEVFERIERIKELRATKTLKEIIQILKQPEEQGA
ncbi:MAG: MerR family transcriptional regulator [Planctomycetes bacterium]|nr:MerR family transcriptional regulator [Planctomycetota bacterium]